MDRETWERYKAALVERWFEIHYRLYARTRNPIHAFDAYRKARAIKKDVPGWVLELFDQWAETLCVNPPKGAKAIAHALGLGTKGGPAITSKAETQIRNLRIAERVLGLRDPERDTQDIFLQVAEEFNLSSERVAAIWYDLTRAAPPNY